MKGISSLGAGLLLAGALLLAFPDVAGATCPPAVDVSVALEEAVSVFVGEVVATQDQDRVATMSVISIWKGPDLPEQIEVRGTAILGGPVSPDDRRFTAGQTYLVIPENTRQPFLATNCSATRASPDNGLVIPAAYQTAVGASSGRAPAVADPEAQAAVDGFPVKQAWVIAGVVLAAGVVGLIAYRQRPGRRRMAELIPKRLNLKPVQLEQVSRWHKYSLAGIGRRLFRRSGMRRVSSLKHHH